MLVHAAGFGVDPDEFPETLEHFGITPVEAASFGCIPVVYGQGGPKEVVSVLGCDTTFSTIDECAGIISSLLKDPRGSTAERTSPAEQPVLLSRGLPGPRRRSFAGHGSHLGDPRLEERLASWLIRTAPSNDIAESPQRSSEPERP